MVPVFYLKKLFVMLQEDGLDTSGIPARAGFDPGLLGDKEARVGYSVYIKAIEAAIDVYGKPGLGLIFGRRITIIDHGIIGYAFISSATFRDAIRIFVKYQNTTGPLLNVDLVNEGDVAIIRAREIMPLGSIRQFALEEYLANWMPDDSFVTETPVRYAEVRLDYPAPKHADMYTELFHCPIHFDQDVNEIRMSAEHLDMPFRLANEATAAVCAQQCEQTLRRLNQDGSLVDRVRRFVMAEPRRTPDLGQMASKLNMGARTLRRRLNEQGTSYQRICDEIRMSLAMEYLERTDMNVQEIAYLLSYTEASNFQRAFKRWTGKTPIAYRKSVAGHDTQMDGAHIVTD